MADRSKLQFISDDPIDKIVSDFDGNITTHTLPAATLSGGLFLPETDTLTLPNPYGQKAYFTMHYSIDDGNTYFPNINKLFQPGNPVPTGLLGAGVAMAVDSNNVYFYFTHYLGSSTTFKVLWTLDTIE